MANSQNSRLQEQKYAEADYIFQTIEMANEETAAANSELDLEADYFSWKVVKRRQKPQRRYTVSHGAPPAPPSTPTSLSKEHDPLMSPNILSTSPTSTDTNSNGNSHIADDSERFKLLYTLDYTPKFKKKLKEQERTSAELAELFKVVTITGGNGHEPKTKIAPEHGVSFASRRIRRELNVGSFKIHRNPIEHTRELFDEDSLSAPEFDGPITADDYNALDSTTMPRRWRKIYRSRKTRRKLLVNHFELMEHMDEIADSFDTAMSFRPARE